MRQRRTSASKQATSPDEVSSEQYVRAFGQRYGWELGRCNLMLEGTTDVAYFDLANRLYADNEHYNLIDEAFRVHAIGIGEEGGTDGMMDRLRLLAETLRIFPIDDPQRRVRVVCLFDDDAKGRGAFNAMSGKFIPWSDIFLLRRKYPRTTRDPKAFDAHTRKLNEAYLADKNFFCEIEDLVARSVIDTFVGLNPSCLQRELRSIGDGFHCDLHRTAKGNLLRFVEENALLDDVRLLVELLKSFRFLFGLPVNGTPVSAPSSP